MADFTESPLIPTPLVEEEEVTQSFVPDDIPFYAEGYTPGPRHEEMVAELGAATADPAGDWQEEIQRVKDLKDRVNVNGPWGDYRTMFEKKRERTLNALNEDIDHYLTTAQTELAELTIAESQAATAYEPSRVDVRQAAAEEALLNIATDSDASGSDDDLDVRMEAQAKHRVTGTLLDDKLQAMMADLTEGAKPLDYLGAFVNDMTPSAWRVSVLRYLEGETKGDQTMLGFLTNVMRPGSVMSGIHQMRSLFLSMDEEELDLTLADMKEANFGFWGLTHNPVAIVGFLQSLQTYSTDDLAWDVAFGIVDTTVVADVAWLVNMVRKGARNSHVLAKAFGKKKGADAVAESIVTDTPVDGLTVDGRMDSALGQDGNKYITTDQLRGANGQVQERLLTQAEELYANLRRELEATDLPEAEVEEILANWSVSNVDPAVNSGVRNLTLADDTSQGSIYWVNTNTGEAFETEAAAMKWAEDHGLSSEQYSIVPRSSGTSASPPPDPREMQMTLEEAEELAWREGQSNNAALINEAIDAGEELPQLSVGEHSDSIKDQLNVMETDLYEMADNNAALHSVLLPKGLSGIAKELEAEIRELAKRADGLTTDPQMAKDLYADVKAVREEIVMMRKAQVDQQEQALAAANKALGGQRGQGVVVSPDLTATSGMLEEMKRIFGIQGEMLVMSDTAINTIRGLEGFQGFADRIVKGTTQGTAFSMRRGDGSAQHVIVLKSQLDKAKSATTLLHEVGHSFMNELLIKGSGADIALREDFLLWLDKAGEGADFRKWIAERNGAAWLKNTIKGDKVPTKLDDLPDGMRAWQTRFSEYFADGFQKFALSDAAPKSAIERTFKDVIDRVTEAYKYIQNALGLDASKPREAMANFLKAHIDRIAKGEDVAHVDSFLGDLDFVNPTPKKERIVKRLDDVLQDEVADTQGYTVRQSMDDNFRGPYAPLGWDLKGLSTVGNKWVLDPRSTIAPEMYDDVVAASFRQKAVKKAFTDYLAPFLKGRSKQSLKKIENLLQRGDQYTVVGTETRGKEFSFAEALQEGLTAAEAETYLSVRQLRRVYHTIRDSGMVKSLRRGGYKQVTLKEGKDKPRHTFWGRRITWDAGRANVVERQVYDAQSGTVIRMTPEKIQELEDAGKTLVQLKGEKVLNEDLGASGYAIVTDADDVKFKEIESALGYRPGEMSRIYDDEYFITQRSTPTVDGVVQEASNTAFRTARTAEEAGQFADDMNAALKLARQEKLIIVTDAIKVSLTAAIKSVMKTDAVDIPRFINEFHAGRYDDVIEYGWKYNRSIDEYISDAVELAHTTGGQFSGARGNRLPRAFAHRVGEENQILDPWRSLAAETMNLSRFATTSEIRERHILKWVSTFNDIIPAAEKVADDPVQTFFNVIDHNFGKSRGDRMGYLADANKDYLKALLGQPDEWERKAGHVMRALTEDMGLEHLMPAAVGRWIRQAKPLDFFRSFAFDVNLGLFNPAQLFVQANGAFVSIAAHPIHGLKAAYTMPLLRMALMSDNPEVWRTIAKFEKLTKLGLSDVDEFVEMVGAVKESGLLADLTSTAFHTSTGGGGLAINESVVGKIRKAGRFFYNRGEEVTRLAAWDVARRVWKQANPGQSIKGAEASKTIMARADDLMLNMTEVNKAAWQKGPLAIPFQFLQYNFKLVNQVVRAASPGLKSNFTPAQATRMFGAHLLFYGAAGTGILAVVDEALTWFMGEDEVAALDKTTKLAIAQGIFSALIHAATADESGKGGTAIATGTRLGAGEFYNRLATSILDGGGGTLDVLTGPAGANLGNFYSSIEKAMVLTRAGGMTLESAPAAVLGIISDSVSSMRSATKAYMWYSYNMKAMDSRKNNTGDVTTGEIIGRALGFEPQRNLDTWNMMQAKKDHDQGLKEIANTVNQLYKDSIYWQGVAIRGGVTNSEVEKNTAMETSNNKMAAANTMLGNLDAGDMFKVQSMLRDELMMNDSQFSKMYLDLLLRTDKYELPMMPTGRTLEDAPDLVPNPE